MLPHVLTWLPTGTIVDDGTLAERTRSDGSEEPYPDPDSWFQGDLSHHDKLISVLDMRINAYAPASKSGRRRLRHLDEVPRDAKKGFSGYYLSHGLLSKDISRRLAMLPVKELEKIERIWLSIEDALLLSSPEAFIAEGGEFVKTQFRWVISKLVTSGYQELLKDYKAFIVFVKARAIRANVQPKGVAHFPGFSPSGEWLGTGLEWLNRVINRGLRSKGEGTRLAHFVSTRGLPSPTKEMVQDSLRKHRINLITPAAIIPESRMKAVRLLSRRIGRRVTRSQVQMDLENPEHVSLTNSSSFAYSRTDGGRAAEVQYEFDQWANHTGQERTHVLDYHIAAGTNWRTVLCYPRDDDLSDKSFGDPLEGGLLGLRRAGYDNNLGFQILQCAAEAGQKREILDEHYKVVGHPHVRASVSSEPGGKARIVTANEWWVTILLQPLGHILVSLLEEIPSARAGLSRAEPAWEWVEDLLQSSKRDPSLGDFYRSSELLTSDLSEATDHCHRDLSRQMLEGFFEGVGLETETGYLRLAIDLLVCRKMLHSPGLNIVRKESRSDAAN
ncbi:RNA-dependent RNA polymerase [Aspergillus tennesseensis narnavirus 1]|nr:RNA-dependent RNA polymerase [Aspergillus tennesseensis narnavirus 1]